MHSYQIELVGEVLRVGFNRNLPAQGDRIVRDAVEILEQKIDAGEITGGERILIDGAQSVAVSYALAHRLGHLYQVVAVLDPKLGRKIPTEAGTRRLKNYIVSIAHGAGWQVGDVIETEEDQPERNIIKVALCGPPHSGKSCLREGLKKAILGVLNGPYPYVITACPDGEGSWYQEAYEQNPALAIDNKNQLKAELTPEFAAKAAQWVKNANQPINIIDVGGKISPENEGILSAASHAIILVKDPSEYEQWRDLCRRSKLGIIAEIHSDLKGSADVVNLAEDWRSHTNEILQNSPLLTGSVHRLERGQDLSGRPSIAALAEMLIHLTKC
jgi:CRISPR-associated protein Csx3